MTSPSLPTYLVDQVPVAARADEAERALLGACILWPRPCIDVAARHVSPDDFFDPARQRLFAFLLSLDEKTQGRFDLPHVKAELAREGGLEAVGGEDELITLADETATPETAELHARAVHEAAVARRLRDFCLDTLRATGRPDFRPAEALPSIEARLARLARGNRHARSALAVRCATDIEAESVSWLWPGRLPVGKLTILLGNPGQGKSLATLAVAAAVTRGAGWPDAPDLRTSPATVLLASAEDDPADTIRPRAEAAGVDLGRLQVVEGVGEERTRSVLDLGRHLDALRDHLNATPEARLLILDPLAAFMLGPDSHKGCEVRAALAPLAALAQDSGVAILAVHHMRKAAGQAIHRGLGSIAFTAAARSVLGIGPDPANPTGPRRLLVPVKGNLSAPAPVLAFGIRPDPQGVPVIAWEAGPVEGVDADTVLGGYTDGTPGPDPESLTEAIDFLRSELADGPRPQSEILRAGRECGHAEKTIRRAKKKLGVTAQRSGFGRGGEWRWSLSESP